MKKTYICPVSKVYKFAIRTLLEGSTGHEGEDTGEYGGGDEMSKHHSLNINWEGEDE